MPLRPAALLALALVLAACSSSSSGDPSSADAADATDEASVDAPADAAPATCAEVCATVSGTTCAAETGVPTLQACVADCETARAKVTKCVTEWNAVLACCERTGLTFFCGKVAQLQFSDCRDICKSDQEIYEACVAR
jgi:hypothetical protein